MRRVVSLLSVVSFAILALGWLAPSANAQCAMGGSFSGGGSGGCASGAFSVVGGTVHGAFGVVHGVGRKAFGVVHHVGRAVTHPFRHHRAETFVEVAAPCSVSYSVSYANPQVLYAAPQAFHSSYAFRYVVSPSCAAGGSCVSYSNPVIPSKGYPVPSSQVPATPVTPPIQPTPPAPIGK